MYLLVLQVAFQNIFECFSFLCTCQQLFFCYSHQYCLLVTVSFLLCTLYFLCRGSTPVGVANFRTSPSYWMKLFQFSLDQFFGYKNFNLIIVKIWLSTIFLNHGTGPCYSYISLFGPSGTPSVGILLTHSHLRKCSNINSYMRCHVQQQQLKITPMYTSAFTIHSFVYPNSFQGFIGSVLQHTADSPSSMCQEFMHNLISALVKSPANS